ncbi:MAG: hypothetical protein C4291_00355 [Candidatus Dadabacteria bacterium]
MVHTLRAHSARLLVLSVLIIVACGGLEQTSSSADFSPTPKALEDKDILSICIEHKNLAFHIHMTLEIYILNKKQVIPKNTGISRECMHVIHTHDKTGKLHIESPYYHQFHLKDFFIIWGKTFNRNCIFQYCVDENHTLSFFVNGVENDDYENLPLRDGDVIRIVYSEKK